MTVGLFIVEDFFEVETNLGLLMHMTIIINLIPIYSLSDTYSERNRSIDRMICLFWIDKVTEIIK